MSTAVVVGSGPNGLAAAVTLARRGVAVTILEAENEIGGGTRSGELTVPGLLHDVCSGVHPLGSASPLFRSLGLEKYGLTWRRPDIDLAHPLDDGRAAFMVGSVAETAAGLGVDAQSWHRLFDSLSVHVDDLLDELLQPLNHPIRHPITLGRIALPGILPASTLARLLHTDEARALLAGCGAHSFQPLASPLTGMLAMIFVAVNERYGWPVAKGGSAGITAALAALLHDLGGKIETGVRVTSVHELPPTELVLFDMMPAAVADVLGDRLPARVERAYRRYRFGPGAFKLDLAVDGGIPWTNPACRQAGTVHVSGSLADTVVAERDINAGRMPDRPFIIVGQQYLADPCRSRGDIHPVYAYAHVPHGFTGDATQRILDQLERFAPGTRDRILASACAGPSDMQRHNANCVGGDIAGGAATPLQLILRPRPAWNPYFTGIPGMYLCSSATPPGPGVHGMAGYNAAQAAWKSLCGRSRTLKKNFGGDTSGVR